MSLLVDLGLSLFRFGGFRYFLFFSSFLFFSFWGGEYYLFTNMSCIVSFDNFTQNCKTFPCLFFRTIMAAMSD